MMNSLIDELERVKAERDRLAEACDAMLEELWAMDLGWCDLCLTSYEFANPKTGTGSTTCPQCGPLE